MDSIIPHWNQITPLHSVQYSMNPPMSKSTSMSTSYPMAMAMSHNPNDDVSIPHISNYSIWNDIVYSMANQLINSPPH